jgi:sarcosine oxidase, subunit gamma
MSTLDPIGCARDGLAGRDDDLARIADATDGAVVAKRVPFLAQVNLRLDPDRRGLVPSPLPLEPNTALEEGGRSALWLGPDEWLILGPPHTGADLADELDIVLGDQHRSVVDLSANRVTLELTGPGRFHFLAKGCRLDLHPRSWHEGMCAQTMLSRTQVILHERSASTRVLVRSSFADYLVDWMLAAAAT